MLDDEGRVHAGFADCRGLDGVGGSINVDDLEGDTTELVQRHGVTDAVRFTGRLADDETLNLAYRAADVFALPSSR